MHYDSSLILVGTKENFKGEVQRDGSPPHQNLVYLPLPTSALEKPETKKVKVVKFKYQPRIFESKHQARNQNFQGRGVLLELEHFIYNA